MASEESRQFRKTLTKLAPDRRMSLADSRKAWENGVVDAPLADGVHASAAEVGGVRCLWLEPEQQQMPAVIVFGHGGGMTSGSIITHRTFGSHLAKQSGCRVLLPDYRLLPENPPDAPSDDFMAVHLSLKTDPAFQDVPIVFGGDSSGAAVALAAMVKLRSHQSPLPEAFFAFSGAFDATLSGRSHQEKEQQDPLLGSMFLKDWQNLFDPPALLENPVVSPLFADLHDLPPALLLAGGDEVWLDDTHRLHEALQTAGTISQKKVFDGMWHVWPMTPDLPESREAYEDVAGFIRTLTQTDARVPV